MENRNQDVQVDEQTARSARQLDARARAREAADKVGIGKSQSLFTMVLFSVAAGILIASYVLFLGIVIIHKKHTDTRSEAAFEAARELSDITVEHPSTGPLSLCRWRDKGSLFFDAGTEKARSIESIKRTYSKIDQIAELSRVSAFRQLLQTDEQTLKQLESDLRARLDKAILPPATVIAVSSKTITGGSGVAPSSNVLNESNAVGAAGVANMLNAAAVPGISAVATDTAVASDTASLQSTQSLPGMVGTPNGKEQITTVKTATDSVHVTQNDNNLARSRIYKSIANLIASRYGMSETSKLKLNIKLGYNPELSRKDSAQIFIINADKFRIAPPGKAPNMVQLSFLEPGKKEQSSGLPERQTITCVGILPAVETPAPAAFVLSFPQGTPGFAATILDYLNYKDWSSKGLWTQATSGELPGGGQLAPPVEPLLTEMTAGNALAAELYHWLKYAGDKTDPQAVVRMFKEPLILDASATNNIRRNEHSFGMMDNEINSCLVNDTGSRQHALMYESRAGGAGQAALARAFMINGAYNSTSQEQPTIPENALPVFIDPEGRCSVSGNSQFDTQLIREFFQDLYATNLAARETLATIKPLQQAIQQSIPQTEQKLGIERDELASLIRRQNKSGDNAQARDKRDKGDKRSVQQRIIIDRISDLRQIVDSDSNQLEHTKNLQKLIRIAKYNASRAELNTFELNAQKLRYCRDGISKALGGGYLLGDKLAFRPVTRTLVESDLDSNSSDDELKQSSPWLSANLSFTGSPAEVFRDLEQGKSGKAQNKLVTKAHPQSFTSVIFVIDSRSIVASNYSKEKRTNFIKAFTKYPFANIKLPQSELLYYCQTSVKTGSSPKVGWSVLARDFLANRGRLNGEDNQPFVGLPLLAENSSWFSGQTFGASSSPGLGCEFQIRTPLPLVENSFENAYLQNAESGQRMPLIPLVTPDML